jgi:hypothetical protein
MQFIQLHGAQRPALLFDLQLAEVIGAYPGLPHDALHRASVDIADVRCRAHRAAMGQTLEDALDRFVRQLRILPQCAATLAEALPAI